MNDITFVVPGKPFAKERPRARVIMQKGKQPFVQIYAPARSRRAEAVVARIAADHCIQPPEDDTTAVTLDVIAVFAWPQSISKKKRAALLLDNGGLPPKVTNPDPDNVVKLIADALQGIAYQHDGKVWLMRAATVWGDVPATHVRLTYSGSYDFPQLWW